MNKCNSFVVAVTLSLIFYQFVMSGEQAHIDIIRTELRVNVSRDNPMLDGEVHYNAVIKEYGSEGVIFNSYWLEKDSIKIDGEHAQVSIPDDPAVEEFIIYLPENVFPGDTVTISIWYTRPVETGETGRDTIRGGYYFFQKDSSLWNDTAPHTTAYTMSQPDNARAWFPAIDKPSNKSTLDFYITVSEPAPVIANGTLINITDNDDGSQTYYYDHPYPIAPYLIAFNTGPFEKYETVYESIDGRSIPVFSYLYPEDEHKAGIANEHMINMLGIFEELFGPYPFERHGMIGLAPFRWIGMEHQTITTMRRNRFTDELIIAHELAHHWWGNSVTCESWKDIWLNEGFASYSEALYEEKFRGISARDALLARFAWLYFESDELHRHRVYDPPEGRTFSRIVYMKGAWILHMLRSLVGDDLFFHGLKDYASVFEYDVATTDDFISIYESLYADNLDWFFEQWLYDTGHPVYRVETSESIAQDDAGIDVSIRLRQVQHDAPEVFKGPVDFRFVFGESDTTLTFWNDVRDQEFMVNLHASPVLILFDPDDKILKQMESDLVYVEDEESIPSSTVLHQNYPNPFNHSTVITFELAEPRHVRLKVVDANGRIVEYLVEEYREAGSHSVNFDAAAYASGIYFAVLDTENFSTVRKMIFLK